MNCPKCTGELEQHAVEGELSVYRCNSCAGIWCRGNTLDDLMNIWMSDAIIDVGSPQIGQRLDKVRENVECPEGHGPMIHMNDEEQVHIGYECCATCKGVYLDAGEFTDLKHRTPIDTLKKFARNLKRKTRRALSRGAHILFCKFRT